MKIKSIKPLEDNEKRIISFSIYTDTDSIFYPLEPLMIARYGKQNFTDEEFIEKGLPLINEIQNYINKSYDVYAKRYHNVSTHGWNLKQELLARRGFWSGKVEKPKKGQLPNSISTVTGVKKRYAQWIVNKKGVPKNYMDVKGLESVRSNYPKIFRSKLAQIFEKLLHDCTEDEMNNFLRSFKKQIKEIDMWDIMIPTSVNSVEDYSTGVFGSYEKKTPAHVKAALNYNSVIDLLKLEVPKLTDGDKILWCYLTNNPYYFDAIAISRESNPPELINFVEKHIDRNAVFENLFLNKVQGYYSSIGWGKIQINSNFFF